MKEVTSVAFWGLSIVFWSTTSSAQNYCSHVGQKVLEASHYYNQTLESPGYPWSYNSGESCSWTIKTTNYRDYVVKVIFNEFFLQNGSQCNEDSLSFYDGSSEFSESIGRFCGINHPEVLYATGVTGTLYIKFISSSNFYGINRRFKLSFSAVPEAKASGICSPSKSYYDNNNLRIDSPSGTFFTPNYPVSVRDGMYCEWVITVPSRNRVRLQFESFDVLPSSSLCRDSYVEILDGSYANAKSLGTYCGTSVPPILTSSAFNRIKVKYYAGYSTQLRSGFKAHFSAVEGITSDHECLPGNVNNQNLQLSGLSGTFTSPLYPSEYPPDITCTWIITVPDGRKVQLDFRAFDLKDGHLCHDDYVEVRDGTHYSNKHIGTYCGSSKPSKISSSDRYLWVTFSSGKESYNSSTGFKAEFKATEDSDATLVGIVVSVVILFLIVMICTVCIAVRRRRQRGRSRQRHLEATPMVAMWNNPEVPSAPPQSSPGGLLYPPPSVGYAPQQTLSSPEPLPPPYSEVASPPYPGEPQYPPPGETYPWSQKPQKT